MRKGVTENDGNIIHLLAKGEYPKGCIRISDEDNEQFKGYGIEVKGIVNKFNEFLNDNKEIIEYLKTMEKSPLNDKDDANNTPLNVAINCQNTTMMSALTDEPILSDSSIIRPKTIGLSRINALGGKKTKKRRTRNKIFRK